MIKDKSKSADNAITLTMLFVASYDGSEKEIFFFFDFLPNGKGFELDFPV